MDLFGTQRKTRVQGEVQFFNKLFELAALSTTPTEASFVQAS
jgi:hypothetical protein